MPLLSSSSLLKNSYTIIYDNIDKEHNLKKMHEYKVKSERPRNGPTKTSINVV